MYKSSSMKKSQTFGSEFTLPFFNPSPSNKENQQESSPQRAMGKAAKTKAMRAMKNGTSSSTPRMKLKKQVEKQEVRSTYLHRALRPRTFWALIIQCWVQTHRIGFILSCQGICHGMQCHTP